MLSEKKAQEMIENLLQLRKIAKKTNDTNDIENYLRLEEQCTKELFYLITMRTGKYKNFPNYDDLNQEGYEALLRSMKNYDPSKGSFLWWAHKYIKTKVARAANLHTTIRYPMKYASIVKPKRERTFPIIIESRPGPEKNVESSELVTLMKSALINLNSEQKKLINLAFGLNGEKPLSITKICEKLDITRPNCIFKIKSAFKILRRNIKF